MKRISFFVLLFAIFSISAFAQTIDIVPQHFIEGEEYFLGGCKPGNGNFELLKPSFQAVLDSGLTGLDQEKVEVLIEPQADGTRQASRYTASQLPGINYRAQKKRFETLASYLRGKGFKVIEGRYLYEPKAGAQYRGAWIRIRERFDCKDSVKALQSQVAQLKADQAEASSKLAELKKRIQSVESQVAMLSSLPKATPVIKRVDALSFANANMAVGGGLMVQFRSDFLLNATVSEKRWSGEAERSISTLLGYSFFENQRWRLAILVGPIWKSELDDNAYDDVGLAGLLHTDLDLFKNFYIFGQVGVDFSFRHQHGKVGPSYLYQDLNDLNTIGVRNDIIRQDKKFWQKPKLIGRIGLSISL